MASTIFTNYQPPAIRAEWLNDVNSLTYGLPLQTGATLVGTPEGTVQDALDGRPTSVALALPEASAKFGYKQAGSGAVARNVEAKLREIVSVLDFGAVGDGLTDDTVAAQAAIDAAKGGLILFPAGYRFCIAGLSVIGASYNGTSLTFEGELVLKVRPTAATNNFGGAWVGLIIKDCDRVSLAFMGDGQRALQPDEEHCYLVGVAGATKLNIPTFRCREIRGDGLYISQSNWASTSANTDGFTIGLFEADNSIPDGRNGLSIISADNGVISSFRSNNVGAVVNGVRQPGGLDIEPNHVGQSVKHITIGSLNVTTQGTSGLAVQGRLGADVTRDISIGPATVINTCPADVNDGAGNLTQTGNHTLVLLNAADVRIPSYSGQFTNAYGDAVVASNIDGLRLNASVKHVRTGMRGGADTADTSGNGITNSSVTVDVSDVSRYGLSTGKLTNCTFNGIVSGPAVGYYVGALFGVHTLAHTQTDVTYSVSVRASTDWTRSYRRDATSPPTYVNVVISNCDVSGTWAGLAQQAGDMQVLRLNMRGVTDRTSIPSVGTNLWVDGQQSVNVGTPATGAAVAWYFKSATSTWNVLSTFP